MSSTPRPDAIADTTALRHFAVSGHLGRLATMMGGVVRVPREVLDPDEDLAAPVLSEIGQAIRYMASPRYHHPDRETHHDRLMDLRREQSIVVVDLDPDELEQMAQLSGRAFARQIGRARLGAGESAVMSVAIHRSWTAFIDDKDARLALETIAEDVHVLTCQGLLRREVADGDLESPEAELIYDDLVEAGFRGPASLWH